MIHNDDERQSPVKCPHCGQQTLARHTREMVEADDDMTDGQMSDYLGGGEEWWMDVYNGICQHCKKEFYLEVI